MNVTIYEEATWYDIERNKMHLKRDGEHYVADAMLLRENANLRQENERLKKENDSLREICADMWRLLLATGNDDLVLSIEANGVVKEVIDAEELAKTMRELGIKAEQAEQ